MSLLWFRIEREHLRPVLGSRTGQEFEERLTAGLPGFVGPWVALSQLLPPSAEPRSIVAKLLPAVEAFGGERWVDAVSDGLAAIRRATKRFDAVVSRFNSSHAERIGAFGDRLLLHAFAMSCLGVLLSDPRAANAEIRESVRLILRSSASDAYATIRSIELELRAESDAEGAEAEGADDGLQLSGEAQELEVEAEEASRENLEQHERA